MTESESATQTAGEAAQALAESLFGPGVCEAEGVLHVSATVRNRDGRLHVLTIGPDAPKSEHDFFALNLCRARADALLTSAENLRREPALSHALAGPHAAGLSALRQALLHKAGPPQCAILTQSGDLPLAHPAWADGTPKLVFTPAGSEQALALRLGQRAEVIALAQLDPRKVIQFLVQQGARTVSIEAGPRVAAQLYEGPRLVDELLLSRFDGQALPPTVLGGALPDDSRLFAGLSCLHESVREEPSGRWIFQRWARTPPAR